MEKWFAGSGLINGQTVLILGIALVVLIALTVALGFRVRGANRRLARSESAADAASATPDGRTAVRPPLWTGLAKTRTSMLQRLLPVLGRDRLDASAADELESALLGADVGVRMTQHLIEGIQASGANSGNATVRDRLEQEVLALLESVARPPRSGATQPNVIMVIGVNGVGKTTTIGKLAAQFRQAGRETLLVAGDTFRAAAIEQLGVWAERTGADIVRHQQGGDPGAVVYDGIRAALARRADVVIVDTAGRLHTKSNLMEELRKIRRIIAREIPGAPHETLLVIDAITGQNGLIQARAFLEHLEVTGIVLTKLDGTAKGGIVVAIAGELGIPILYVGVGEKVEDLRRFDAKEFAAALLAT